MVTTDRLAARTTAPTLMSRRSATRRRAQTGTGRKTTAGDTRVSAGMVVVVVVAVDGGTAVILGGHTEGRRSEAMEATSLETIQSNPLRHRRGGLR